jgi:hypothetical protein
MKTIKSFFLFALLFFFCAGLCAQVTFGGLNEPKSGTILDLNSTLKGGLILSNVALNNLFEIPSSFPGVNGANPTELKEGLKGAVVYNTNSNTCIGVHVWNGEYWERITSTQAPEHASIITLSTPVNIMSGDKIEFTAASGAKTYKWYESENDGAYEYLGVTAEPKFSKTYIPGNYKVKVVMDNCHSLEESNELSFRPASVSPNFGSADGKNIIYVYGDFSYAAADEYVSCGLVGHYDGINNQGKGDKGHDFDALSWIDLKSGFELPRGEGEGKWLSNGFQPSNDDCSFSYGSDANPLPLPAGYPFGNAPRTIEAIFRTPKPAFVQKRDDEREIFMYGLSQPSKLFGIIYRGMQRPEYCNDGNDWVFYAISGNMNNLVVCLFSTPTLETPDTINTVTSTYQNNILDTEYTNSYINNKPAIVGNRQADGSIDGSLNTPENGYLNIGSKLAGATILSVRLYNRVLNSKEIAQNADLDQRRYLTPPEVRIGGNPCTEVVVLSPHFLMCKAPEGIEGLTNVEVNGITYPNAYQYVNSISDFYISKISPIVGPTAGGISLTLTGNMLNEITKIEVDGVECENLTINSTIPKENSCTFNLPAANSAGEVDITITTGSGNNSKVYRFAKVFEYQ